MKRNTVLEIFELIGMCTGVVVMIFLYVFFIAGIFLAVFSPFILIVLLILKAVT